MGRKPTNAALYELMGKRPAEPEGPRHPPAPETGSGWFGAGHTLRLPVGYILLAVGGGILLLALAFSAGYVRGHRQATTILEQEWLATHQGALPVPPPEVQPALVQRSETGAPTKTTAVTPLAPAKPSGPGQVLSDPRVEGLNYFILIHTQRDNAVELARFCRQGGVEAYAVPVKNGVLYRVLMLPGYAAGDRSSEPVRALEQRIAEVIRKWKLQVNPRDELAYYPERFGG